jgi:hypothetical protein
MKKILLLVLLLILPALAFADGHWENHHGFLYWVEANGNWHLKGRTPESLMTQSEKQEAKQYQDASAQMHSEAAKEENEIRLQELANQEKELAQAERDRVQQNIEIDLSDISSALERMEMDSH